MKKSFKEKLEFVAGNYEDGKYDADKALNALHTAEAHQFEFDNTPVADVLRELSDYYGCKLTAPATRKCLTATFNDDGVDSIVALIEATLGIDITVEK